MSFHTPDKNLPSWIPVKQAMGWLLAIDTFLFVGGGVSCALLLATYLPPAMGEVVWSGPLPKTTWTIVGLLLPLLGVAAWFHFQWMDKAQTRHIEVRFGALAPRLHDQVGLEAGDLAIEQRLADAVVLCAVQGVLTQAEKSRAFKRIFKRIQKRVEELQN